MKFVSNKIWRFLFVMLLPAVCTGTDAVVGYYPCWVQHEYAEKDLDLDRLTHVMHAFAYPLADGTIAHDANFLRPPLNARVHDAGKFILLSLGGWGNSEGFPPMAADSSTRKQFIQNTLNFCLTHNYDGVDLDWEYPKSAQERQQLTLLVKEMRQEFDKLMRPQPLFITMAVTASDWTGKWVDYDSLKFCIDWFGCMTYDFHGPWTNHAGHNSPLYPSGGDVDGSVSQGITYLTKTRNVPSDQVLLGVPFYGRGFNALGLYEPTTGDGGEYRYSDIPGLLSAGWTYNWDDVAQVPYLTNPERTKVISFDDTTSVRLKAEYAIQHNLKGVMVWALGQDFIDGQQPLLQAVSRPVLQTRIGKNKNQPTHYALSNFPNPFNATTSISFSLPRSKQVILDIYDITGRRVARLFKGEFHGGYLSIPFANTAVPSGVYICALTTANVTLVNKMTLLR